MFDTLSPDVLLRQALGALFFPPLNGLLLLLAGGYWQRRAPAAGRLLLLLALLLSYLQATPWLAMRLNGALETFAPATLAQVRTTGAIVVLGGGQRPAPEYAANVPSGDSLARLRYGAYLARASGLPLLLTGGAPNGGEAEAVVMARVLQQDYGITPRWVEAAAETTADNARLSAALLREAKVGRITLVTQAWHMPRALPSFRAAGLQVLAAPTGYSRYDGIWLQHWLPSGRAMQEVYQAEREWLGLLYYRLRSLITGLST
ncbi:YdcF family protein [Vogesella sp. AC12]|uniref:YdcF family protein n=1 Tax=Vogesella sp. AC12 TaxID=2950550 RepID=UPI00210C7876|nr:YdcF family protein [Vogesella sp. AC12]MCQ4144686.1 YdcF family protein [Vogesella sp. AC12]